MSTMAVSFRFKDDSDRDERYQSFMERLRSVGLIWDETTSFALVQTDMTAAELESDPWVYSKFNSVNDKMIVIDVTNREAATRGRILYPNILRSLLPKVTIPAPPV